MSNSVTPWTVAGQTPLAMGFPRQEYWSGLPFAPPLFPFFADATQHVGLSSPTRD